MPKEKDLKKIVRGRMAKTGESYTAARRQVLAKEKQLPVSEAVSTAPVAASPVESPELAALAGASDHAVVKATGRGWKEWAELLDAFGAMEKPHREVAAHVRSLGVSGWWSQSVTVGYERIRGLREKGQRLSGSWEVSRSRTFPVAVERLYATIVDPRRRKKWLGKWKITVRKATPLKSIRMSREDGTAVEFWLNAKGEEKSTVSVQHSKLASKEEAEKLKHFWGERLNELGRAFEEP